MEKLEKMNLALSVMNALIYRQKVRHDTNFIRITLQCYNCKKVDKNSGKYLLTMDENILGNFNEDITNNKVAMIKVQHFVHCHLNHIEPSQIPNSSDSSLTNKPCSMNI